MDVNAYSLQQEALNTEKRDADWFVQTQLRSRHVLFVSAGSHATTESFSSLFKNQEPLGLTNSKANAPVVDLQTHVTVEQGVSKSLADLDISKSRKVSSADPSAPSPTSSSISSSDEIVFIGKDPIARQHVITETAGWDFAGATTISTPTAIKSLVGNPKDNNDGDGDSVDDDEAILRDYIENVGGFDGLRGDLDGGISQFGFLGRRLDIGEESGPEELHVGTRNMAYQIQKDELFEGKPATFEKFDRDSTPDDEDEIPEFGRSYRSSFFPASLAKTTGEETAMQSDGSAITRTALSQSLIDLVGAPGSNFDVMDRSRPSLQLRSKKGALAMPPHLSDAEFQESMTEALETDRQKKKARKGEREALRKQGLLGKSKPDLKEKYEDGMNLDQIKQEFIQFCKSPHQKYVTLDSVLFELVSKHHSANPCHRWVRKSERLCMNSQLHLV